MKRISILALFVSALSLASCHHAAPASTAITCTTTTSTTSTAASSSSCTDPATGISIAIAPPTVSVIVATSTQFQAAVSGGTNSIVTWQVNSVAGGNDTVGRIDATGKYIAPVALPSPVTVNVAAVSYEEPKLSVTAVATITAPPKVTISPTSWTLSAGTANTKTFTATVTGAPTTNVDWQVNGIVGGNATLGTISAAGIYTAPNTPPIGSTVTVTAVSRDFPASLDHATVTISGYSISSFQGSFAFSMSGTNAAGNFSRAGSFTADGAGHLLSGLEDVNPSACVATNPLSFGGSYTIGSDGHGTMMFNDGCPPATFSFVLVNNNQVQISGFDATGTATGQANLQDLSAFRAAGLNGTYVFDFAGVDGSSKFLSQIGEFTADGFGGITSGSQDSNDAGVISSQPSLTGSYLVSSNGRGTATLGTSHFSFYIVSRGSAKFVGTDAGLVVSGQTAQQSPNATFDATSLNGNFAFLVNGSGPTGTGTIATAGNFSANGNGLFTSGVLDQNSNGTPATNVTFSSGSYTVTSNGRGTATFTTTPNRTFVFYLSSTGTAFFQETDSNSAGDGFFTQQQSGAFSLASLQGSYALQTAGISATLLQTIDGQVTANGAGAIASGAIDINTAGTVVSEAVSGTYSLPAATNGRATLVLNSTTPPDNRNFAVYVVNSTQVIVMGIDSARVAAGTMLRRF